MKTDFAGSLCTVDDYQPQIFGKHVNEIWPKVIETVNTKIVSSLGYTVLCFKNVSG